MAEMNDLQVIGSIKQSFMSLNYLATDNTNEQKLYIVEKMIQ